MHIQDKLSTIENKAFLELSIEGQIELIELTTTIHQICQRGEELQATLCINLVDCAFKIKDLSSSISIQDINRWEQAVRRIERFSGIVIAFASGTLSGPGFDLFLATDYRIVKSNSRFSISSNQEQIWPGMMIHRLVHQIGLARCRQLLIGLRSLTVNDALTMGLIDEISDDSEKPYVIAAELASLSNKEYAIRRQLMSEAVNTPFEEALGTHLAACDRELRRLLPSRDLNHD